MVVDTKSDEGKAALSKGFRAVNDQTVTGKITHVFDYSFKYKNVKYGTAIKNRAYRSVYTVVPFKLNLEKKDADRPDRTLKEWVFTPYYYTVVDGKIIKGNQVRDYLGNPVRITDIENSALIVPEGYNVGSSGSSDIILVETKAPVGIYGDEYKGNTDREFYVNISWTSDGTMKANYIDPPVTNDEAANAGQTEVSEAGELGDYTLTAYNTSEFKIDVQVDKDTIKKTSAAFVSLPGEGRFDYQNVGKEDEMYRYDIDFRSLSNIDTDEFVVDDPLENVNAGEVKVEGFWTPVVWGDKDNSFYVFYKADGVAANGAAYSAAKDQDPTITKLQYPNDEWTLCAGPLKIYDEEGEPLQHYLIIPKGVVVKAIRLDYGGVKAGFSSKNYADVSINGENRDAAGKITLDQFRAMPDEKAIVKIAGASKLTAANAVLGKAPMSTAMDKLKAAGEDIDLETNTVDWTPVDPALYNNEEDFAELKAAKSLMPASYLVSAVKPMDNVDIVSSVTAKIAKKELTGIDQDAVLTKEIVTFEAEPENPDVSMLEAGGSKIDKPKVGNPSFKASGTDGGDTTEAGKPGVPVTGDEMMLALSIIMIAAMSACLITILIMIVKQKKRKRIRVEAADTMDASKGGNR
jgi:hypothetical protein